MSSYQIHDNLRLLVEANYIALWLDQSSDVWGGFSKNGSWHRANSIEGRLERQHELHLQILGFVKCGPDMFDAVIRPACRTKPLPAAGDLPFGAVACGIPSCGSPPTSGHSLRQLLRRAIWQPRRGAGRRCSSTSRQPSRRRRESCCSSTWQSIRHCRSHAYPRICRQSEPHLSG